VKACNDTALPCLRRLLEHDRDEHDAGSDTEQVSPETPNVAGLDAIAAFTGVVVSDLHDGRHEFRDLLNGSDGRCRKRGEGKLWHD